MQEEAREQQEKLIQKFNRVKNRIARNKLILVTVLNVLTFLIIIFAMSYFEWIWVYLVFNKGQFNQKQFAFWANLLYIKEDYQGSPYESFNTVQQRVCEKNIYCSAIIYQFQFVGYISFCIFALGGCLQLYDFVRMIIYVWKSGQILQSKDNFRHMVSISTYAVGLSLSVFSITVISPDSSAYGISFWICLSTLIVFVMVIIYEQISIRRMIKQSLILDLIEKQKKVRAQQIRHKDIEMSNQISVEGQGELTL